MIGCTDMQLISHFSSFKFTFNFLKQIGKDNTGVTDRVVNQLLTLIDGADATMGGVVEDTDQMDGQESDGGSSNQVLQNFFFVKFAKITYEKMTTLSKK